MGSKNAPSFITLDIEVFSEESLDLLADYFEKSAIVLAHQKVDDLFFLRIEPRDINHDEFAPENCAQLILKLVSELPEEIACLWNRAKSKTFDFGFESGNKGPCFQSVISAETLTDIAKVGASFTITIYQVPEDEVEAE